MPAWRPLAHRARALRAAVPYVLSAAALAQRPAGADRASEGAWHSGRLPLSAASSVRHGHEKDVIAGVPVNADAEVITEEEYQPPDRTAIQSSSFLGKHN